MRWTLWLMLIVLLSVWQDVSEKPVDESTEVICIILAFSGGTLFWDYLKKRKKK